MKYGNYTFLKENIKLKENSSHEEICQALANSVLDKILNESPETKLYLMFAYEIVYDKDFEKVFLELEKEALEIIDNKIHDKLSKYELQRSQDKKMFISRLLNAIVFAQNLFSDKKIFENNKEKLYRIFYDIYYELLKQ